MAAALVVVAKMKSLEALTSYDALDEWMVLTMMVPTMVVNSGFDHYFVARIETFSNGASEYDLAARLERLEQQLLLLLLLGGILLEGR